MDQQLSILGELVENRTEVPTKAPPAVKKQRISKKTSTPEPKISGMYEKLVSGVRSFFQETGFRSGVIGVSGGVDSALTLKIAADALGSENVTALIMPELGVSSQENIDHAKVLCGFLKVKFFYIPINSLLIDLGMLPWKPGKLAMMNVRPRLRMNLLYNFANTHDALVLGTSNKSELLLGYGTKHGDLACDIEVIGDLLKTEVIALADEIGLPLEIVHKTPTAELEKGQTDEGEMGHTYADMDKVLSKIDLGLDGAISHGLPATLVHDVFRRVSKNEHKTKPAFVIPVHQ